MLQAVHPTQAPLSTYDSEEEEQVWILAETLRQKIRRRCDYLTPGSLHPSFFIAFVLFYFYVTLALSPLFLPSFLNTQFISLYSAALLYIIFWLGVLHSIIFLQFYHPSLPTYLPTYLFLPLSLTSSPSFLSPTLFLSIPPTPYFSHPLFCLQTFICLHCTHFAYIRFLTIRITTYLLLLITSLDLFCLY